MMRPTATLFGLTLTGIIGGAPFNLAIWGLIAAGIVGLIGIAWENHLRARARTATPIVCRSCGRWALRDARRRRFHPSARGGLYCATRRHAA